MTLTLLAHGSPDPRHARAVTAVADRLRGAGVGVGVAYLDHNEPGPAQAARALAEAGVAGTTVVPLLVAPAYHARIDVPAAVATMRVVAPGLDVRAAAAIGLHPLVLAGAVELAERFGLPIGPRTGVIVAAAGSRDPRAAASLEALVRAEGPAVAARLGAAGVRAAQLDGGRPVGRIGTLMRCVDGATDVVVVPITIAEGVLRDRIVAAALRAGMPVAPGALADTRALAELVLVRAAEAGHPGLIDQVRAIRSTA